MTLEILQLQVLLLILNKMIMKIKTRKNEILWTTIFDVNHIPKFAITSDKLRTTYTLNSIDKTGKLIKLKQNQDPSKLNDFVDTQIKRM